MRASFLSRLNKQLRGAIALSFLLVSLLGSHWIGFSHGIAHAGIQYQNIDISCTDHEPSLSHSSAHCHLLDALTLAGFITSDTPTPNNINAVSEASQAATISPLARLHIGLYLSRAPPSFIL
jgi:hypothetical protein